jgi:hypothetical protein
MSIHINLYMDKSFRDGLGITNHYPYTKCLVFLKQDG